MCSIVAGCLMCLVSKCECRCSGVGHLDMNWSQCVLKHVPARSEISVMQLRGAQEEASSERLMLMLRGICCCDAGNFDVDTLVRKMVASASFGLSIILFDVTCCVHCLLLATGLFLK